MSNSKLASLRRGEILRFGLVGLTLNALAFGVYVFGVDFLGFDPRLSISLIHAFFLPIGSDAGLGDT